MILQKINRILNNKYFVGFCIVGIITAFTLFQLLGTQLKYDITAWIQYPLVLLPLVVVIVCISNFNVCLAIIMLVSLLSVIFTTNKPRLFTSSTSREGFESESTESTAAEMDAKEKEANTQYYVDGIKNIVAGRLKKMQQEQTNTLSKGILENKKKILDREKKKNSKSTDEKDSAESTSSSDKVIQKRLFNPNKEDDTNLLITKEILLDMINRIEYNYENTTYLRKYIKSRIEEIIDTNNLLDEDL